MSLDRNLETYFEQFNRGHALAKQRMMAAIAEGSREGHPMTARQSALRFVRVAVAVAAALVIAFGLLFFGLSSTSPVNPSVALADAVENTNHVHSIHFKASTPSSGSSAEMWWRQPSVPKSGYKGDYRLEVSNGIVFTCNDKQHATFDSLNNKLTLKDPSIPGLELMILGELGQMFGPNRSLSRNLLKDNVKISEETIIYKGEKCLLQIYQNDIKDQLHKCIVGLNPPLIYEAEIYKKSDPTKAIWHIEVLEVDKTYPDDLFRIASQDGVVVRDRRGASKVK